jgi:hypothetical protein
VKKLSSLFVAVVFLTSTAGLAFAQAQPAPMPKAEEKKMASKNANGTVKSAGADSVVVTGKDKGKEAEWTFALDPKTKIKRGGKNVAAGDLKPGDAVQVRYMEHGGKAVAQAITVKGSSTAKKDDKAGTKPAERK